MSKVPYTREDIFKCQKTAAVDIVQGLSIDLFGFVAHIKKKYGEEGVRMFTKEEFNEPEEDHAYTSLVERILFFISGPENHEYKLITRNDKGDWDISSDVNLPKTIRAGAEVTIRYIIAKMRLSKDRNDRFSCCSTCNNKKDTCEKA